MVLFPFHLKMLILGKELFLFSLKGKVREDMTAWWPPAKIGIVRDRKAAKVPCASKGKIKGQLSGSHTGACHHEERVGPPQ